MTLTKIILPVLLILTLSSSGQNSIELNFSTYIPHTSNNCRDIHSDCQGNIIMVGGTSDTNFQCSPGTISSSYNGGNSDVYVIKLDSLGNIIWQTLLGGSLYDRAYAVEVDQDGFIYVGGRADDTYPTTECSFQPNFAGDNYPNNLYGNQDGFITKITPDGSEIVWSSFIGGPGRGFIRDFDIDADGNVYAGISACDQNFPHITSDAFQGTAEAGLFGNSGLVKISADGQTVEYGTFITDGGEYTGVTTVRVHEQSVFLLNVVGGAGVPTTEGVFQSTAGGNGDFVISKFNLDCELEFCSYLGGTNTEGMETHSLEIDSFGRPVVASSSNSADFPVTTDAFQNTLSGQGDGFISIISADGSTLEYSTYLGGSSHDEIEGVAIDEFNRIYFTGNTQSTNYPISSDAFQTTKSGGNDGIITVFDPNTNSLVYSSYWGGNNLDLVRTCHIDPLGRFLVAGGTRSGNIPLLNPQYSTLTGNKTSILGVFQIWPSISPDASCVIQNGFQNPCTTNFCAGDMNADGFITSSDLILLLAKFGNSCSSCPEDIDFSGTVTTTDLTLLLGVFGTQCN